MLTPYFNSFAKSWYNERFSLTRYINNWCGKSHWIPCYTWALLLTQKVISTVNTLATNTNNKYTEMYGFRCTILFNSIYIYIFGDYLYLYINIFSFTPLINNLRTVPYNTSEMWITRLPSQWKYFWTCLKDKVLPNPSSSWNWKWMNLICALHSCFSCIIC